MPTLYDYQRQAVQTLQDPDKHIVIAGTGSGKTAMLLTYALSTRQPKWLVVTTASARDSGQWYDELALWANSQPSSSVEVISWQALAKWTTAHWSTIDQYCFLFDEVAKAKAGISSARGRAFLQITKRNPNWAGATATPGDRWIDFQAYFIAGGYIRNKSQFLRDFCQIQTFKGYPEIIGYNGEAILRKWWQAMTVCPDTSQMEAELPPERHFTHNFRSDPEYKQIEKTHTATDGTFLDTTGAYCAELRRACFTKQKQQWLADYLENLGTNAVLFYALTETGDKICEIAKKALPKGAKIWRIYGKSHDIPTKKTIGKHDIVVCQWEAGSEALNLQFMNQWVSVEPCYSYSTSVQARGRIKRIGQEHSSIVFHYLKCEKTIEERIYDVLKNKSDFSEANWVLNK